MASIRSGFVEQRYCRPFMLRVRLREMIQQGGQAWAGPIDVEAVREECSSGPAHAPETPRRVIGVWDGEVVEVFEDLGRGGAHSVGVSTRAARVSPRGVAMEPMQISAARTGSRLAVLHGHAAREQDSWPARARGGIRIGL